MSDVWLYESDKGVHVHFIITNVGPTEAEFNCVEMAFDVMLFGSRDPRRMQCETGNIIFRRILPQGGDYGDAHLFSKIGLSYSQRDEQSRVVGRLCATGVASGNGTAWVAGSSPAMTLLWGTGVLSTIRIMGLGSAT
jgi:hypothetical protein